MCLHRFLRFSFKLWPPCWPWEKSVSKYLQSVKFSKACWRDWFDKELDLEGNLMIKHNTETQMKSDIHNSNLCGGHGSVKSFEESADLKRILWMQFRFSKSEMHPYKKQVLLSRLLIYTVSISIYMHCIILILLHVIFVVLTVILFITFINDIWKT